MRQMEPIYTLEYYFSIPFMFPNFEQGIKKFDFYFKIWTHWR